VNGSEIGFMLRKGLPVEVAPLVTTANGQEALFVVADLQLENGDCPAGPRVLVLAQERLATGPAAAVAGLTPEAALRACLAGYLIFPRRFRLAPAWATAPRLSRPRSACLSGPGSLLDDAERAQGRIACSAEVAAVLER
jgi:hypothetical protein